MLVYLFLTLCFSFSVTSSTSASELSESFQCFYLSDQHRLFLSCSEHHHTEHKIQKPNFVRILLQVTTTNVSVSIKNTANSSAELKHSGKSEIELQNCGLNIFNKTIDLNLSNLNLTSLSPHSFNNLSELQKLDLKTNKIKSLPNNVFAYLTNLKVLLLSDNPLEELNHNSFCNLNQLEKIVLINTKLVTYDALGVIPNLKILITDIQDVTIKTFCYLEQIEKLYLLDPNTIIHFYALEGLNLKLIYATTTKITNIMTSNICNPNPSGFNMSNRTQFIIEVSSRQLNVNVYRVSADHPSYEKLCLNTYKKLVEKNWTRNYVCPSLNRTCDLFNQFDNKVCRAELTTLSDSTITIPVKEEFILTSKNQNISSVAEEIKEMGSTTQLSMVKGVTSNGDTVMKEEEDDRLASLRRYLRHLDIILVVEYTGIGLLTIPLVLLMFKCCRSIGSRHRDDVSEPAGVSQSLLPHINQPEDTDYVPMNCEPQKTDNFPNPSYKVQIKISD